MKLLLSIICVYVLGYFSHALYLGGTVYGDGRFYYAWLTGEPSKFSIGPALFWTPVYLLTHNEIAVGLTSVLATVFALILLLHLLQKSFSKTVSLMTIAAVAGASNLFFYGSLDVVNSHALTFFAATVYLALLAGRQWLFVGVALGFLGLMRAQDLVYGILLIPFLNKKTILPILFGFALMFSPQLLAWHVVSGKFWLSPYVMNEGFNVLQPHILGVLFNIKNGLFLWTPIALLGTIGLVIAKKYWMLGVFFLELFIIASWSTWWQGASYSGRMFVSSLPLFSFGIASIFTWLEHHRFTTSMFLLTIVGPLTAMNALSIIYYLLIVQG